MGSGTDVALETADAALTHNRLRGLAQMITLARATHANIRQNITIALGLKAIFPVTTLLGFTGLWLAIGGYGSHGIGDRQRATFAA